MHPYLPCRFVTGLMVWTSLGLVVAVFGGLLGFSIFKYIDLKDDPLSQGNIFQVWTVNFI